MKVLPFSTTFPSYHPRKGQSTMFVEKIWMSLLSLKLITAREMIELSLKTGIAMSDVQPKGHTVRAGHRWKAGDWFQPVIWGNDINPKSGRKGPYHSKQIKFAPPMEVKKTWDFEIVPGDYLLNGRLVNLELLTRIAANDGLSADDLEAWFYPYAKKGNCPCQIICWAENIEY